MDNLILGVVVTLYFVLAYGLTRRLCRKWLGIVLVEAIWERHLGALRCRAGGCWGWLAAAAQPIAAEAAPTV